MTIKQANRKHRRRNHDYKNHTIKKLQSLKSKKEPANA